MGKENIKKDFKMETIVLDYTNSKVTFIKHNKIKNLEKYLSQKGFDLENCEWMSAEKLIIEKI